MVSQAEIYELIREVQELLVASKTIQDELRTAPSSQRQALRDEAIRLDAVIEASRARFQERVELFHQECLASARELREVLRQRLDADIHARVSRCEREIEQLENRLR